MTSLQLPPLPIPRERVEVLPNRRAWELSRSLDNRIGGSDVAQILDRSPYGGPWQFWLSRKQPAILPADAETAEQGRGKRYEVRVLEDYAQDFGIQTYLPRQFMGTDAESEIVLHGPQWWMAMTPDAFGYDPLAGSWGLPEAKTSALPEAWGESCEIYRWDESFSKVVPPHIVLQGYWYLACTDLPWLDVVVLIVSQANSGLRVRRYRFYADHGVQGQLVEAIGQWRDRHLRGDEPPPVSAEGECRNFLGTRFGKSDTFRDPNQDELALAHEFVTTRQRMKTDEKRAKYLEALLIEHMGEAGGLYLPGENERGKRPVLRRVCVSAYDVPETTLKPRHQPACAYLKLPKE